MGSLSFAKHFQMSAIHEQPVQGYPEIIRFRVQFAHFFENQPMLQTLVCEYTLRYLISIEHFILVRSVAISVFILY